MLRDSAMSIKAPAAPFIFRRFLASLIGSGPKGCDNRFPIPEQDLGHNSLAITDPLVIYKNYIARGILRPDEQQFRAAIEFQKLYHRVRDYEAPESLSIRIKKLVRKIEQKNESLQNSPYNFSKKFGQYKPRWFDTGKTKTQVIKVLTDEEELLNFPSPQGLLINGPVGSGKSLLMDIFASSLPHDSKCRWHYNNFMLWVYNEIHTIYKRRLVSNQENHTYLSLENEFILFEIAQNMISKNTILLLDEFMLPDIAALKVVKILFTYFFKLGGVLVATSNRLPEELYSTDFNRTQFEGFLGILKIRCHSYDMVTDNDYRKILSDELKDSIEPYLIVKSTNKSHEQHWQQLVTKFSLPGKLKPSQIVVYGRTLHVPALYKGVVQYDFNDICLGLYGPGDYISLASTYHTFILDNVPVLTLKKRNEARRFITLLDALYESKCKLIMRSDVELDQLFFPEVEKNNIDDNQVFASNSEDVQTEEMFSKTEMALLNPYRPNIASYDEGDNDYKTIAPEKFSTNFRSIKKFTGEDEMFAYKRAVSRMNEMTGSPGWRTEGKWSPIDKTMRPWETQVHVDPSEKYSPAYMVTSQPESKAASQFKRAPSFQKVHFWALGFWNQTTRLRDDIARRWIKSYYK